jgi:hypothetical protein
MSRVSDRGNPVRFSAVAGHPSDGEDMKTSKSALEGLVSLVISVGGVPEKFG